jgi:Uma2 family endonuclease
MSQMPMLPTKQQFLTFEEYLQETMSSEGLYELFNGELIQVPPESGRNVQIATFLLIQFVALVGYSRVRGHGLELEVRGEPKNRYPDLTILRTDHIDLLSQRNTVRLHMPPPMLVVEVVSPGDLQHERDYLAKRSQYEDLAIPAYWLVDPQLNQVTVLTFVHDRYHAQIFHGDEVIQSVGLPELSLTAAQILQA